MVETAYDYCMTVLLSQHVRGHIQQAIGALALEIVLKSFLSLPTANLGTMDERYSIDKAAIPVKGRELHELRVLRDHLRPDIRTYLLDSQDNEVIEEFHDAFTISRYAYEPGAPLGTSDCTMRLAMKLVCKALYLYKHLGCQDSFVQRFDVNATYFKHVQPVAMVAQ